MNDDHHGRGHVAWQAGEKGRHWSETSGRSPDDDYGMLRHWYLKPPTAIKLRREVDGHAASTVPTGKGVGGADRRSSGINHRLPWSSF